MGGLNHAVRVYQSGRSRGVSTPDRLVNDVLKGGPDNGNQRLHAPKSI